MTNLEFIAGLGHATECQVVDTHSPRPLRFIWHHILPQACGGKTVASNLIQACDNCHYAVHVLLWDLGQGIKPPARVSRGQLAVAQKGYDAAVAAGTVSHIPKEASS